MILQTRVIAVVFSCWSVVSAFEPRANVASVLAGGRRPAAPVRTNAPPQLPASPLQSCRDGPQERSPESWGPPTRSAPPAAEEALPSRRRAVVQQSLAVLAASAVSVWPRPAAATGEGGDSLFSPKFVQQYSDFVEDAAGYSYRDVTVGREGDPAAAKGDRVVYDWSGYTIGYFGRPFQAKGGPQGGAFDKDLDYARVVLGSGTIISGLETALVGMRPGGVRQVIVPYGKLSYPADDPSHDRVGPKPSTFSGDRALNFVLENPRLDRTLLFNVKVVRVDKPDGRGGFIRG